MYNTASGVPIPQGTDAFSPATQFKGWGDFAATYESRVIVALDSDRTALASPVLRDGTECYVKNTELTWVYAGTTWTQLSLLDDSGAVTLTLISPWVAYASGGFATPARRKMNGRVELFGMMKLGAPSTTIDTLPTGWRPLATRQFITPSGTGAAVFNIASSGTIQVTAYTSGGGNGNVSLDGIAFFAEQ